MADGAIDVLNDKQALARKRAYETPIEVLLDVIQPYPTFSEGVFLALRELNLDL